MNVAPHVAQNTRRRRSAIDGRTTRHAGYAASQRVRKRIEEAFGWIKTVGGLAQDQVPRPSTGSDGPSPSRPRLQPGPAAASSWRSRLMAKARRLAKAFAGRWRIVEMDVWDNDFLDLVEQAHHHLRGRG